MTVHDRTRLTVCRPLYTEAGFMAKQNEFYIGIDIGGTKCAVTLGKYNYETQDIVIIDKIKFSTNPEGAVREPVKVMGQLSDSAKQLLSKHGVEAVSAGISCGGPLDSRRGIIMSPPNLPGWDNVEAVQYFTDALGIPCVLQNDANACAAAEWMFGAGKGTKSMVFMTFGTGLGAGMILDGRLYSGASDMAGEVGHVRCEEDGPVGYGKAGSYEGFCSGGGIAKLGELMGLKSGMSAKDIAEGAYAGDEACAEVYRVSGEKLGKLLSIIIDIINPEAVVIGGVFARSSSLLLPHAEKVIQREALSYASSVCRIVPAGLGELVGDYSALAVALFEKAGFTGL